MDNLSKIENFMKKFTYHERYEIDNNGKVNVFGDIRIHSKIKFCEIPIKFGYVTGDFDCASNHLTTLKGCPDKVQGEFNITSGYITDLEGCPKWVGGNFMCAYNNITSLKNGPEHVGGDFICENNHLTSLLGSPEIKDGLYDCSHNFLEDLKGSPEKVKGFFCAYNNLTTLKGGPKWVDRNFDCSNNYLMNLEGFPEKAKNINVIKNNIYDLKGYKLDKSIRVDYNPISTILTKFDVDELNWFRTFKPIIDTTINLKRFKYVMDSLNIKYDLDKLKEYYNFE